MPACRGSRHCGACGVLPFRKPSAPKPAERAAGMGPFEGRAINVRCYRLNIVYVKFIGTHAEYDRIDAETVEME